MKKKKVSFGCIAAVMMSLLFVPGLSGYAGAAQQQMVAGKVLGLSKKAGTISLETNKGVVFVKFTPDTHGMEHAKTGHAAKIAFRMQEGEKTAVRVEPKLAQLPNGVAEIGVAEVAALVDGKGPESGHMLIDARPAGRYHQAHIPTAVSMPVSTLKEKGASLLPEDKNMLLVFYCGGVTCGLSTKAAAMAKKMGYANVRAMLVGEPAWSQAGHPVVASNAFVAEGNIVLLDLRPVDEASKGHIGRAVNVPMADLPDLEDELPARRSAPIVLYGSNDDALKAMAVIKKWGYKKVSLVDGGISGWVKAGNQLVTGSSATEISWKRKPGKGEVTLAAFKKYLRDQDPSVMILDVRGKDETAKGNLAAGIGIPLDALESRLAELPKDKLILVHCSTGARAEMAQQMLHRAGHKAKFLVADLECEGNNCTMEE